MGPSPGGGPITAQLPSAQFWRSEVRALWLGSPFRILEDSRQSICQVTFLSDSSGEEPAPRLVLIAGRIPILAAVGLRSTSLLWLLSPGATLTA